MTEYDYSPEAFEKYMERQTSVARWVDRQAQESHNYRNPLGPDEYASPSRSNSGGSGGGGGRGANLPRSVSTPPEPRHQHSHTQVYAPAYGYGQQNQVYGHRSGHSSHRSHTSNNSASTATLVQPQPHRYNSSSSHSHSRSHSTSHTAVYSSNGGGGSRHPPARSRTYATAMASMSATHLPQSKPTRSQTLPSHVQPQFTGAPGQTVVMHNGRQTYVVVPPHGARVQVCSPQSASPTYQTPQNYVPAHYPYAQQVSPTRESGSSKKAPFLKRIFGFPNSHNSGNPAHADYYAGRSGNNVPVMATAGARRRTTSVHY